MLTHINKKLVEKFVFILEFEVLKQLKLLLV